MSPAAMPPNQDSPIDRILNAAEKLFMQHGFEGTSLRQITAEADVNLASVNYHFGSKEALIQEIFRRRLGELNRERLAALDELERKAAGKPLDPGDILDAFFGILLRQAIDNPKRGIVFLRLLGRSITEPSEFIREFLAEEYQTLLNRYKAALCKALPDMPKAELTWRFHLMLGATAYAIGGTDSLRLISASAYDDDAQYESPYDMERLRSRLISFLTAGLNAPLPTPKEK